MTKEKFYDIIIIENEKEIKFIFKKGLTNKIKCDILFTDKRKRGKHYGSIEKSRKRNFKKYVSE